MLKKQEQLLKFGALLAISECICLSLLPGWEGNVTSQPLSRLPCLLHHDYLVPLKPWAKVNSSIFRLPLSVTFSQLWEKKLTHSVCPILIVFRLLLALSCILILQCKLCSCFKVRERLSPDCGLQQSNFQLLVTYPGSSWESHDSLSSVWGGTPVL